MGSIHFDSLFYERAAFHDIPPWDGFHVESIAWCERQLPLLILTTTVLYHAPLPRPRSTATWQISSGSICHHRFTHSRRPAFSTYMPSPPSAPLPLQPLSSQSSRAARQPALQSLNRIAHTMSNRAQPFGNSVLQCRVVLAYLGAVASIGVATHVVLQCMSTRQQSCFVRGMPKLPGGVLFFVGSRGVPEVRPA